MPSFSERSLAQLSTVKPQLQAVLKKVVEIFDFSVVCGRRTKEDQDKAVAQGFSKTPWPKSKHNVTNPSDLASAVDAWPYPRPIWTDDLVKELTVQSGIAPTRAEILRLLRDWAKWYYLAGLIKGVAHASGVDIRQGCNWDSDSDFTDQAFDDIPHHELR